MEEIAAAALIIIIVDMIISRVFNPAYEPANPLHVINWMCQIARKYSTISIPGIYGSAYDQFPLGQLFNRELQIRLCQCPFKKYPVCASIVKRLSCVVLFLLGYKSDYAF